MLFKKEKDMPGFYYSKPAGQKSKLEYLITYMKEEKEWRVAVWYPKRYQVLGYFSTLKKAKEECVEHIELAIHIHLEKTS